VVKVERGMMFRKVLPFALLSALALTGCGGGKDKKEDDENSQYVVMPYAIGDIATINGATEDLFTIEKSGAAAAPTEGEKLQNLTSAHLSALQMTDVEFDHQARSLLNRFNAKLGQDQGTWFWRTARRLDAYKAMQAGQGPMQLFAGTDGVGPIERMYRQAAAKAEEQPPAFRMMAEACPPAGEEIDVPGVGNEPSPITNTAGVEIPDGGTEDAGDYCLVYVDEPTTAGDRAAVKATVEAVLKTYKDVVYKDTFADVDDYSFKPIVVTIDFGDAAKWNQGDALQIAGAFIGQLGKEFYKRPVLYMASDMAKLKLNKGSSSYDAVKSKKLWHGTLAHEMQHAIMDYYKVHKGGVASGEIPAIDEGLAHFMEDLFGYGEENFSGFAYVFLSSWDNPAAGFPVLDAKDSNAKNRGASHALWYYMSSQKGGVTFSEGKPAGGGGLEYIAAAVKSAKVGVANLAGVYTGNWADVISGFYGALVLDGTKVDEGVTVDAKHKVQDTQTITDLNGNTDKQFGMHFNGFGGLADTRTYTLTTDSTTKLEDVSYYTTTPLLYTGADVDSLSYTAEGIAGVNVAKIKLK
jgi:hypothetical protein